MTNTMIPNLLPSDLFFFCGSSSLLWILVFPGHFKDLQHSCFKAVLRLLYCFQRVNSPVRPVDFSSLVSALCALFA